MIRHNADRLEHRLRAANPPGAPLAVHHAADPATEAAFAVARAAARLERDDGSVAVLYRTNAQSRAFEDAFKRAGIRYRITGGQSFYERPEIRDALACLQAGSDADADDEAMRRFVDLPPHPRTGQKAAAQIDRMGAPPRTPRIRGGGKGGTPTGRSVDCPAPSTQRADHEARLRVAVPMINFGHVDAAVLIGRPRHRLSAGVHDYPPVGPLASADADDGADCSVAAVQLQQLT